MDEDLHFFSGKDILKVSYTTRSKFSCKKQGKTWENFAFKFLSYGKQTSIQCRSYRNLKKTYLE